MKSCSALAGCLVYGRYHQTASQIRSLFRTAQTGSNELESIALPHLTKIYFTGEVTQCIRFCQLLKANPMAQVVVHTNQSFNEEGLEDTIASLKQLFRLPYYSMPIQLPFKMSVISFLLLSVRANSVLKWGLSKVDTSFKIIFRSPPDHLHGWKRLQRSVEQSLFPIFVTSLLLALTIGPGTSGSSC
jgi:hypothetical protein